MSQSSESTTPVEVRDVSYTYGEHTVLESVNLTVPPLDFLGLIGPNGGGKTTLLKIILGLLTPGAGEACLFGEASVQGRRFVGYVPQYTAFDRDFPIRVLDVVLMGRLRQAPKFGRYRPADRQAAEHALELAHVADFRRRTMNELSGGQFQRVLIARALAGEPRLLALDEPTANLDTRIEQEIYETLRRLNEHMTIILITHDLGFVSSYVKRVACLNRRLVCHPTGCITGEMIDQLYQGHVHMVHHDHKTG